VSVASPSTPNPRLKCPVLNPTTLPVQSVQHLPPGPSFLVTTPENWSYVLAWTSPPADRPHDRLRFATFLLVALRESFRQDRELSESPPPPQCVVEWGPSLRSPFPTPLRFERLVPSPTDFNLTLHKNGSLFFFLVNAPRTRAYPNTLFYLR